MTINLDAMKQDTANIIADWAETLTVKRAVVTYDDEGKAVETWIDKGTFSGDWQPVSGDTERQEAGRAIKSDAQVFCAIDVDVLDGDKIYRADGSYMYVNYLEKHEEHWMIYLTKTEKSE